ncbi:MAG TPA: hypothetical protein VM580_18770 [Labilithrix sp.]|nr:hypothetical protein [Labilithrix sp.]
MNYLYGDSTTSTLKSNFLEFLRDAIDFCVFVLQADAKIKQGRVKIQALREESDAESARLERFVISVTDAVYSGEKGAHDSPTARCATRIVTLVADAHRASLDGIRQELAEEIARVEAEEAATREACGNALAALLAPHDPPGVSTITSVSILESGHYEASLDAKGEPALEWTLELGIPENHAWSTPMRIERLAPHLEIRAPQLAGWITKEVKVKPLKVERYVVTELVDDGTTLDIELRNEQNPSIGLDFTVKPEQGKVIKAARVAPADDASVGPFELHADDVPLVVDVVKKLRESLAGLERQPNITATFDGNEFRALPEYAEFVARLVGMMAPIVREISQRSLTPNELVLRRPLGNDRREEIFVAKATLRDKLAVLPPEARALFTPLGLEVVNKAAVHVPPAQNTPPTIRSELPPSMPPPPMKVVAPKAPPVPTIQSTPPPPSSSGRGTLKPPSAVPPPRNPPPVPTAEGALPSIAPIVLDEGDMQAEVVLGDASAEPTRASSEKRDGEIRTEALVASLKKIQTLSKNGRAVEAYHEYENLFSSSAFADYRPEEQRQALKLMLFAKNHPSDKDVVASAHKAALTRIQALIDGSSEPEPADQELLGVAHLYLGNDKAAGAAFQAGLEVARAKNPQSELIATLMQRVSRL